MRSQTGSSLSTLVFLIPLLGVPLMAIFGVPQFVPVVASSASDGGAQPSAPRRWEGVGESATATHRIHETASSDTGLGDDEQLRDLFRPARSSLRDSRPLRGEPLGRETKFIETSRGADTWLTQTSAEDQAGERSRHLRDLFGEATPEAPRIESRGHAVSVNPERRETAVTNPNLAHPATTVEHANQGLTWSDAVRRLNELGIHEFRLEPGRQLGEFYFVCEFAPDRDTRITRRFEAEAKEPLLAVAAVLRQIEDWLPKR